VRLRALLVAAVAALATAACGGDGGDAASPTTAAGGAATSTSTSTSLDLAARVKTFTGLSQAHTQDPVTYPQTPPVGGPHNPVWMNCGFYPQPVITEAAVHSLEHGAVWITYRPGLPAGEVDTLRGLARTPHVLVSPWRDATLPAPVVASAWGVQLTADTAGDPGVKAFVELYANGPQAPEKGASCRGAFGTPQQ